MSRARDIGTGLKGKDLADLNAAIKGTPGVVDFTDMFTAFMNNTATDYWVAIIEEYNKNKMELMIYPFSAKQILPEQGYMAYNIGTTLADVLGTLSGATYTWTSSPAAGSYHIISIYATEAFYLKTLTNCVVINNPLAVNSVVGLAAGVHTLLIKATDNTTTSIVFEDIAPGTATPSGLAVTGYAKVAWTANQARGLI